MIGTHLGRAAGNLHRSRDPRSLAFAPARRPPGVRTQAARAGGGFRPPARVADHHAVSWQRRCGATSGRNVLRHGGPAAVPPRPVVTRPSGWKALYADPETSASARTAVRARRVGIGG